MQHLVNQCTDFYSDYKDAEDNEHEQTFESISETDFEEENWFEMEKGISMVTMKEMNMVAELIEISMKAVKEKIVTLEVWKIFLW